MRTRIQRKLINTAVILSAVGITMCTASYLGQLLPESSAAWIVVVEVMALGSMLGMSWICDEADAYFERRAKAQRLDEDPSPAHRNGVPSESWQVDPLDELRAVVYRANVRPDRLVGTRWRVTRAWRGQ